jgi:DNA mismatch endonuclease (patch repair protein)
MADVVSPEVRSRMMAGIRGKNTGPELALRRALHGMGFRYTLHAKNVPGKPDMAFSSLRAVIFIHGCFWHGHDCRFFRLPRTRREFWSAKIKGNRARDRRVKAELEQGGWRCLTVWECATRGASPDASLKVAVRAAKWLRSNRRTGEIRGL